ASETRFELISRHVGLAGPTNGSRVGKTYFPDLIDHRQVSLTESLLLMKRTMAPSSKLEIPIPGCGAEHSVYSIYYTIQHTLYHGQFLCKNDRRQEDVRSLCCPRGAPHLGPKKQ